MLLPPYDVWVEAFKFLRRTDLASLQLANSWTRMVVDQNGMYWPRQRCYRLTFLEYYAVTTLARVPNTSDLPIIQLQPKLAEKLQALQFPSPDAQVPVFLMDKPEPTFLLFEFASGRKFYIKLEPFLNAGNMEKFAFWMDQIADVFFEEEIRGLLDIRKFSPELLELLAQNGLGQLLYFRCKTFGCYEYEAFDQSSVQFMLGHMSIERLEKANGTIYSPELLDLLHRGGANNCCASFSTRWVMGCGPDFTDNLIQHAINTTTPEALVPVIRFTPTFHRQRDLPIPRQALQPSPNVWLVRRELGDWKFEEWELENVHEPGVHFRVTIYIYNEVETDEEAISQFSIERIVV